MSLSLTLASIHLSLCLIYILRSLDCLRNLKDSCGGGLNHIYRIHSLMNIYLLLRGIFIWFFLVLLGNELIFTLLCWCSFWIRWVLEIRFLFHLLRRNLEFRRLRDWVGRSRPCHRRGCWSWPFRTKFLLGSSLLSYLFFRSILSFCLFLNVFIQ